MKNGFIFLLAVITLCLLAIFSPEIGGINSEDTGANVRSKRFLGIDFGGSALDSDNSGGGGGSTPHYYFTSSFLDYTFFITLKNYKAMEDDNLSEY